MGRRVRNITGQRFGKLTALRREVRSQGGKPRGVWICACDCGGTSASQLGKLTSGLAMSCGCSHPAAVVDLTGQRFGRWFVESIDHTKRGGDRIFWRCICECGARDSIDGSKLRRGHSKSCGCLQRELLGNRVRKHGHSNAEAGNGSATYRIWTGMLQRCGNTSTPGYRNYGARGIKVCERWHSFANFLADMGERPAGKSIDRINNDGNYEPANCRWATPKEQARNTRLNVLLTFNGKTQCVKAWAEELGILDTVLLYRLRHGWPVEEVLGTPRIPRNRSRTWRDSNGRA